MSLRLSSLLLTAAVIAGCGGDTTTTNANKKAPLVIGGEDASAQADRIFRMPTPNEFFSIVRQLDGKGDKAALASAPNADRFATLNGRALNFGVYATDMVYASNFNLKSEVVRYYLACKKIGEQLGLSKSFSPAMQARLEKNLTQGDSLDVLTNDAYFAAYEQLEQEKMGPVLAMVLAGGWVESMHLVMGKVDHFDGASPLVVRVAEQKASLEQLVEMMATVRGDAGVDRVREQLSGVRDIYDRLNVVRTTNTGASPSGRMVLGDNVSISLTEEKFNEIKAAVGAIRADITRAEDVGNPS